jgi:putative ABC transport system substrate-binding protein
MQQRIHFGFRLWIGTQTHREGVRDREATMIKKITLIVLASFIVASVQFAQAQQAGKTHRIGVLFFGSRNQPHLESFLRGLRELGYIEGKNTVFEYRYAEGKFDRLRELATELVSLKVDVIVTTISGSAYAAQQVTKTIPIVLTTGDLVGTGLAASLARPGGNVTGLSVLLPELSGKRLELLKETLPKITRIGVLWNPTDAAVQRWGRTLSVPAADAFKEIEVAAQAYRLQLHSLEVRSGEDIDAAFVGMKKARLNALLTMLDPLTTLHSKRIVELAVKNRWPGIYPTSQFVEEGGLMAYGVNIGDLYYRAATYVDKILKGSNPAELPVEQPKKFEFIINLKTAKQIGVTIPPNVLARADRVIR